MVLPIQHLDTTTLAAVITAIGGIFVKVIEKWASKHKVSNQDYKDIIQGYKHQIIELEREIEQLKLERVSSRSDLNESQNETDDWRERYWKDREHNIQIEHDRMKENKDGSKNFNHE